VDGAFGGGTGDPLLIGVQESSTISRSRSRSKLASRSSSSEHESITIDDLRIVGD